MRQSLLDLTDVIYLVGSADIAAAMPDVPALPPFDGRILSFLNAVAKTQLADREVKGYPDVVTFAFWIRGASTKNCKSGSAGWMDLPGLAGAWLSISPRPTYR